MDGTKMNGGRSRKARIIVLVVIVVLVAIVLSQNMKEVETPILFFTITMPRAVLLLLAAAAGFVAGLLTAGFGLRKSKKP